MQFAIGYYENNAGLDQNNWRQTVVLMTVCKLEISSSEEHIHNWFWLDEQNPAEIKGVPGHLVDTPRSTQGCACTCARACAYYYHFIKIQVNYESTNIIGGTCNQKPSPIYLFLEYPLIESAV